jgi:SnoaL-like domain
MTDDQMQYVAHRLAISDVINRYFRSVDHLDFSRLASCFTDDVEASYDGTKVAGGLHRFIETFEGRNPEYPMHIPNLKVTMHLMANHAADIEGDRAWAETYAISHLVDVHEGEDRMRSRGLRYLHDLRLIDGEWRISRLEHIVDWMRQDRPIMAADRPAERLAPQPGERRPIDGVVFSSYFG